ncbi:hypothetical protein [Aliarcobacter butzleri]|uniref:hypothetical protein n=1 Tax=Aliarcobacter butzleri TaxID=28197 RepID=UPI002B251C6E|nr:hypothetical protein [Aliarcobacter butzleri]
MAKNTGDNYRQGSVNNRVQICDKDTGICSKIDTDTNEIIDQKNDKYKGVAQHTDNRRNDSFNSEVDKKYNNQ